MGNGMRSEEITGVSGKQQQAIEFAFIELLNQLPAEQANTILRTVNQLTSDRQEYADALVKACKEWFEMRRHRPIEVAPPSQWRAELQAKPKLTASELREFVASQIANVNELADCIFYTNETLCEIPSMQSQNETLKLQSERILDLQSQMAEIIERLDERLAKPTQ